MVGRGGNSPMATAVVWHTHSPICAAGQNAAFDDGLRKRQVLAAAGTLAACSEHPISLGPSTPKLPWPKLPWLLLNAQSCGNCYGKYNGPTLHVESKNFREMCSALALPSIKALGNSFDVSSAAYRCNF
eukprot:6184965-Pleurochrysis_carterae.AAC.3